MAEDYRITNRSGLLGQGVLTPKRRNAQDENENPFKDSLSINSEASSIKLSSQSSLTSSAGASLATGNATSSLNILGRALDNITSLLEEKSALEEDVPEGLENSDTEAIQERITQIDSEISQITSSTTFNDIDLFSGFTAGSYNIAAVTSQTGDTSYDLESVNGSKIQVEQALKGIDESVKIEAQNRKQDATKVNEDTVSSLVQKIVGEISSPFNSMTATISIIESASAALNPERVNQLTSA